ncbi:hypothetical protein GDO86_017114 [Hymenochirus boettgeri]|uniref:FAST kinase leucine-rich domain-containing protein n=1 Tax=Hymenochirus boettgeri TaxID=247094 RepID=A0A8T2IMC2_9PIPI|nr:hypothetical protein GDO86_017114 [Hymenochirus boettgeri]
MNSKAYLPLFRTIRNLQLCDSVVGTWIPALMTQKYSSKTYCLLKDAGQHVNKCTCARTSYFSLRFLTQKTTEDGNAQLDLIQQSSKDLTDHLVGGVPSDNKFQREVNDTSRLADDEASEDLWVPSNVREESYPEIYPALRKCTSPSDVLDLCSNPPLSAKQISNCFTTMWETSKKIRSEQRRYEKQIMFEHPNFENLCYLAMNTAHRMRPEDLVYTLHAVIKLEINQRSRLVQTLLRACQENLNNFEEREISVLSSSLDGMSSSRNVDALRSGLRLLVEMRLPEIRGVLPLQTMMRAIGKDAPLSLKKKLEVTEMEKLLRFFSYGLDDIPFWKLINVLQSCRELSYRNADLFTAIGDYIINTAYMWQTKQVTLILSMLENLGFRHIPLLDSYAEIVIQSPESLTLKDLLITVKVYSLLNHLPEGKSQQFLEALGKSLELYLPRIPQVELLRVVYSFCILGYFPHQPLDKLLQEDVLNGLLSSGWLCCAQRCHPLLLGHFTL